VTGILENILKTKLILVAETESGNEFHHTNPSDG
jgi:hypothetical protein